MNHLPYANFKQNTRSLTLHMCFPQFYYMCVFVCVFICTIYVTLCAMCLNVYLVIVSITPHQHPWFAKSPRNAMTGVICKMYFVALKPIRHVYWITQHPTSDGCFGGGMSGYGVFCKCQRWDDLCEKCVEKPFFGVTSLCQIPRSPMFIVKVSFWWSVIDAVI